MTSQVRNDIILRQPQFGRDRRHRHVELMLVGEAHHFRIGQSEQPLAKRRVVNSEVCKQSGRVPGGLAERSLECHERRQKYWAVLWSEGGGQLPLQRAREAAQNYPSV